MNWLLTRTVYGAILGGLYVSSANSSTLQNSQTLASNQQPIRFDTSTKTPSSLGTKSDFAKLDNVYDMSLEELLDLKLKPVEVTARKRIEIIRNIPASVSVLNPDVLETYTSGARDIRVLSSRSPSLQIESSFDKLFPRFYLRGLGNTDFDINASQPVSVVFDGVVQENPMLRGFPLFDMQRVEVLRGPQGTLFGRNTPAGVVKLESLKPESKSYSQGSLTYGNHHTLDFKGVLNSQLGEELISRLSVLVQRKDNWIDNAAPSFEQQNILGGFDESAVRFQLNHTTSEKLNWLLNLHYRDFEGTPAVFRANIVNLGNNHLNQNFDSETVYMDAASRTQQTLTNKGGSFTLDYKLEELLLTYIGGFESIEVYSIGDVDGGYGAAFTPSSGPGIIPFPAENASRIPKHEQYTQEIRWSNLKDNTVGYQFGVFAFKESLEIENESYNSLTEGTVTGLASQYQETDAWAMFGTLDYELSEKVTLTTGIRYGNDKKSYSTERHLSPIGAGPLAPIKVNKSDSHLSWDISSIYQWQTNTNLYFRIAKGFRAPSIQGRLIFGDQVTTAKSEQVTSLETGLKSTFWDEQAKLNAALFTYNIEDQQVTAVGGETNNNRLLNVAGTNSYGFELDADFIIDKHWKINLGMSFNRSEIDDSDLSVSICSTCTVTDEINDNGFALIDGNRLPHSPKWIYFLIGNYDKELNSGIFYFQTDWSYRSEINFFLYQSEEFTGPSLLEGGAKLGYRWAHNNFNYNIALFARNITNEQEIIGGVDFNNLTGIVSEPRFVGVEFKVSF